MKKFIIFVTSIVFLLLSLSACANQTNNQQNATSSTQAKLLRTTSTPEPSISAGDRLNSDNLTFDASINNYFGGDVQSALNTLEPLLTSTCFAEYTYKELFVSIGEPLDPTFSWYTLFWLLNTNNYPDSSVVRDSNGSFVLDTAETKKVFNSTFANFSNVLPSIPSDFSFIISVDKNGNYTISSANGETIFYKLKDITLSKANSAVDPTQTAIFIIEVIDTDEKVLTTVAVEVVHNNDSVFGYSIQSANITVD